MTISQETFEKVAALIADQNTPTIRSSTHSEKLRLYGLYKRGTLGRLSPPFSNDDVDTDSRPSRPGVFSVDARMRWDAWSQEDDSCGSREEARGKYVELAKELIGKPVEDLLE
jgi:acyl-CoA-binding protein